MCNSDQDIFDNNLYKLKGIDNRLTAAVTSSADQADSSSNILKKIELFLDGWDRFISINVY